MVTWGVTGAGTRNGVLPNTVDEQRQSELPTLLCQLDNCKRGATRSLPRATTESYTGDVTRLRVPGREPTVTALDCDAQYTLTEATELPEGAFLLSVTVETGTDSERDDPLTNTHSRVHLRFDGPASLRPAKRETVLSLSESQRITVGKGQAESVGPAPIQVPETVAGLATGLAHLSVAHHTLAPSRSHPEQRDHPPILTTGGSESIPTDIAAGKPETGIELRLPATVESLFVAAPLAYYLGADVTVGDRERAVLTADGTTVHREFAPLPAFQEEVAGLVRRLFYLDCLVRRMNPEENPAVLEACTLDPATIRGLTPAGRLERYLNVPTAVVSDAMPEWHLSTHVQPSLARSRCLPFLLDKLSLICLSDGSELDRCDLLDRTLSDTYLTRGSAESTAIIEPNGGVGGVTGWLAPGTPIDAFKTTPAAYENRYRYREKDTDRLQLSVVLNDVEMSEERGDVSEIYGDADLPMDVTVRDRLTTGELAAVFESENDFVHFIGHCKEDGLCCPNGTLSMDSLTEARTRTFFLNACGSYQQGLELVEKGSVAGAVTFTDVLDRHAALVGTAFARLLSNGFTIQRALQLARRRIMMGKDYAVVGDGTYGLLPGPTDPVVIRVSVAEHGYRVSSEVMTPQEAGESYQLPFGEVALNGTETEQTVSAATLIETLSANSLPVIFRGEFHWSGELAGRLKTRRS